MKSSVRSASYKVCEDDVKSDIDVSIGWLIGEEWGVAREKLKSDGVELACFWKFHRDTRMQLESWCCEWLEGEVSGLGSGRRGFI